MTTLITEYNFCKKEMDNDIDIVIDVLLSTLFYTSYFKKDDFELAWPKNNDMIEYNLKQVNYYQSFNYHFNNLEDNDGMINNKYFSSCGLKYLDNNSQDFILNQIEYLDIDFKKLRSKFKVLKRFTPKQFTHILNKLHSATFTFEKFNKKYYDINKWNNNTKTKGNWNNHIISINKQKLFKVTKTPIFEYKNKKMTNIKAQLNFNTKLGHIVFQNLHTVNYNLIPNVCYDLLKFKRGAVYKIYKKLILPYFNKVNCPLDINKIKNMFNKDMRLDYLKEYSLKYMKKIEEVNLIDEVELTTKNGLNIINYKRLKWVNK